MPLTSSAGEPELSSAKRAGSVVLRWVVGLLLVLAAVLKGTEILQGPTLYLASALERWGTPLLIGFELALGLCALAGIYWGQLRLLAMLLFAVFAGRSLLLAIQGVESCGCFGAVKVSPYWTLLLDVVVLLGLAIEYLASSSGKTDTTGHGNLALQTTRSILLIAIISVSTVIVLFGHSRPSSSDMRSVVYTAEGLAIMTPEECIGYRFPLLSEIDLDVSRGEWILLLHKHDCPKCQEAIPKYQQGARKDATRQIALIELPPYGIRGELDARPCRIGRLSDKQEWFVETPLELRLQDSIVLDASTELPFVNER